MSQDEKHNAGNQDPKDLRIEILEEQVRFYSEAMDLAAGLGSYQTSVNKLSSPLEIILETAERAEKCGPFLATAFFLVNELNSDFELLHLNYMERRPFMQGEVANFIENGIFSLALREGNPVTVFSQDHRYKMVLHSLSTSSRARGMFVGLLSRGDRSISGAKLSLLTIILNSCAAALESFELYRVMRENIRRYRELADTLPKTIFEFSPNARVLFVSQGVQGQFGYSPEDFNNKEDFARLFADSDKGKVMAEIDTVLTAAPPLQTSFRALALKKNGIPFSSVVTVLPVDRNGVCASLLCMIEDEYGKNS